MNLYQLYEGGVNDLVTYDLRFTFYNLGNNIMKYFSFTICLSNIYIKT